MFLCRYDTFPILYRYISVSVAIFTLCLLPPLTCMARKKTKSRMEDLNSSLLEHRSSDYDIPGGASLLAKAIQNDAAISKMDISKEASHVSEKGFRSASSRGAVLVPPAVFHRNTSITQSKSLTGNVVGTNSLTGIAPLKQAMAVGSDATAGEVSHGPTVTFRDLTYTIGEVSTKQQACGSISTALGKVKASFDETMDNFVSTIKGEGSQTDNRRNTYSTPIAARRDQKSFMDPVASAESTEKKVLKSISGRCDWGKLTFIMGQKDSG